MVDGSYDVRVKTTEWFRNKIKEQLKPFISVGFSSFVSLCGEDYSQILKDVIDPFGLKLHTPLEGLRIGIKQKRIKDRLKLNIPLQGFPRDYIFPKPSQKTT
jgi:hypothetical protein